MQQFFNDECLKKIKSIESPPKIVQNFLTSDEVNELINFETTSPQRFAERRDARKTGIGINGETGKNIQDWDPRIRDILVEKIENEIGSFDVISDEYPPHFFRSVFPVAMHADTGHDPNTIIGKQILIPLEITPKDSKAETILFDRKWYGPAANFIAKNVNQSETENHYVIPDINGKFVKFDDIRLFFTEIEEKIGQKIEKNGGTFEITEDFIVEIKSLIGKKRYNLMTNEHIINDEPFDYEEYKKRLTHLDYDSLQSLKIQKIFTWKPGSALIWDRVTLHASNNYMVDGVKNKLGLAIFTIKK